MKRTLLMMLSGFVLFVFGSVTVSAEGADADVRNKSVGGENVSYSHWLTYMDERGGMNTQSHYDASAGSKLDEMSLSWTVYDALKGNVADSNSFGSKNRASISDNSKKNLAIERSKATFKFDNNGAFWNPTSTVYHHTGSSSSATRSVEDDEENSNVNEDENIINDLRTLYSANQKGETQLLNADQNESEVDENEVAKDVVNNLFKEDYEEILEEYTFETGEKVNSEDFVIENIKSENKEDLNAKDIELNNFEENNSTIIELEMPNTVYNGNNEYDLTGYVVFIDNTNEIVDYGISGDKVKE